MNAISLRGGASPPWGMLQRLGLLSAVLVLAVGVASTSYWLGKAPGHALFPSILGAWTAGVLIVAPLTLLYLALRFLRWQFLLRHLGVQIPIRRSGFMFALLLPMVFTPLAAGEAVLGSALLRPYTAHPVRTAILVWFLGRCADACILLALIFAASGWGLPLLTLLPLAGAAIILGGPCHCRPRGQRGQGWPSCRCSCFSQ